jgi:ribosomal protein S27AE
MSTIQPPKYICPKCGSDDNKIRFIKIGSRFNEDITDETNIKDFDIMFSRNGYEHYIIREELLEITCGTCQYMYFRHCLDKDSN